jgi:uncharacterized protein YaaQ
MKRQKGMSNYLLLLAVVQRQDANGAIAALTNAGLRVTWMGSLGGFLETGNVTLLMQLEATQVDRAVVLLKETCVQRATLVNAAPSLVTSNVPYFISPIEVVVGGAIIFALPIRRVVQVGDRLEVQVSASQPAKGTSLLIAIVQHESVSSIVNDLTNSNYRVTRISTTGGFLRKGNATLLIGVQSSQVEAVLHRIEHECLTQSGKNDSAKRQATIFELAVDQFMRI